jgi:hypothetical protein
MQQAASFMPADCKSLKRGRSPGFTARLVSACWAISVRLLVLALPTDMRLPMLCLLLSLYGVAVALAVACIAPCKVMGLSSGECGRMHAAGKPADMHI